MDVRVITLRYQDALQGFSEEAMRKAISGREVLEAREHFFMHGNVPHLLLTLLLGDVPAGGEVFRRREGADPEEGLEEARRPLYRELKRWRNERARADGKPAYAIARNTQLAELLSGAWRPGPYGQFRVTDPKPRTISCAPVRDRVVHHALCGVIAPLLERGFTEDCYACRVGMGTHRAAERVRELVRRHGWTCKLDIRRYFDSVPHDRLLEPLLPMFREKEVCRVIEVIVRQPVPGLPHGRGLPIGNLTSQWFANFYLSGLDHYAKEVLKAPGYIRYMDDMVLFADGKAELWRLHDGACAWVAEERGLEVKGERTVVAPVTEGLAFLGLRIFRGGWRFQRARLLRTRRKFRLRERQYLAGEIDGRRLAMCAAAADGGSRRYGFKGILQSSGALDDERIWAGGEGAESGSNRVKRGGSWNNTASNCRSAYRNSNTPSNRNNNNGFRLVSTMQ